MKREDNIVRASAEEISRMLAKGGDRTDWARVHAMSQEEVERLADEEDGPLLEGWESTIEIGIPCRKQDAHVRLDADPPHLPPGEGQGEGPTLETPAPPHPHSD